MAEDGDVKSAAEVVLTMWTIYFSPLDYSGRYVVRAFDIVLGEPAPLARKEVTVTSSLEEARAAVPPGLFRVQPLKGDTLSTVETWM
jgi:hypothetical protein